MPSLGYTVFPRVTAAAMDKHRLLSRHITHSIWTSSDLGVQFTNVCLQLQWAAVYFFSHWL